MVIPGGLVRAESSSPHRRLIWGVAAALLSVLLGVVAQVLAVWVMDAGPELLVYVAIPEWALIFGCHLLSGFTALAALVLLLPPLVKRISRVWLRRLTAVMAVLAGAMAALPWLLYFVGMGLNAASASYAQVRSDSGESIIVEQSGFDRRSYSVYSQESWWLWQRSVRWMTAPEVFDPKNCTLAGGTGALELRCGGDNIAVPPRNG